MRLEPYRWRAAGSFAAHFWKAATQQHHRELAPLIRRLVPGQGVVFDVGAHAGQFTKLFARTASSGHVYAFEPGSYARTILRSVVWLHRLDNVTIVPAALGAEAGTAALNMPIKASGARGFGLAHLGDAEARWASVAQETVAQTRLDDAVAGLGLDRLDFIKADIEGWEVQMLQGARDALRRFRPRLVLELTAAHLARAGDTLDGAFRLLAELGYCAFLLRPDGRLAPAGPGEGDFWFLPREDPIIREL
jgi:FkbM family methyltransferase